MRENFFIVYMQILVATQIFYCEITYLDNSSFDYKEMIKVGNLDTVMPLGR
jgi:hypothetical protein